MSKCTFLYDRQHLLYRNKRQVKTLNQLIIIDVFQALDDTERGEGGFGSTGENWKWFEHAFYIFCSTGENWKLFEYAFYICCYAISKS